MAVEHRVEVGSIETSGAHDGANLGMA